MSSDQNENRTNPILAAALGFLNAVAPGVLTDPIKAMRRLVPRLRYLVVARVEKLSVAQLEIMRSFPQFETANLIQIRKALQSGEVHVGPFPADHAEQSFVPVLQNAGLSVTLRELTPQEQAALLEGSQS